MPRKIDKSLPDKNYAFLLGLGLMFLVMGQFFFERPGTLALVLRWSFLAIAAIIFCYIFYRYNHDHREEQKEKDNKGQD